MNSILHAVIQKVLECITFLVFVYCSIAIFVKMCEYDNVSRNQNTVIQLPWVKQLC